MVFGVSEEVRFTCTFSYQEILYTPINPLVLGSVPQPMLTVGPCGVSGVPQHSNIDWVDPNVV